LLVPHEGFSGDGLVDESIFVSNYFVSGWEKLRSTRKLRKRTEKHRHGKKEIKVK